MKRYQVVFSKKARRQFETEAARWREGHSKNTYLLEDEVGDAVKVLAATPRVGGASGDVRLPGARRMVLEKSEFLLYYRVLDDKRVVELLSLWYAKRGSRPNLSVVGSKSKR